MSDVEETIVVPKKATEAMTKAATEFAMQSCITSKYPWRDYMSDLWAVMVANAPATPKPDTSPVCVEAVPQRATEAIRGDEEALKVRAASLAQRATPLETPNYCATLRASHFLIEAALLRAYAEGRIRGRCEAARSLTEGEG